MEDFDLEELLVDYDIVEDFKTASEIEQTYLMKVEDYLPKWESWLNKNLHYLEEFEKWELKIDDRNILAAAEGLRNAIQKKAKRALNHAHDLWCVKAWMNGLEFKETLNELEKLHQIRSDVIQNMMPRLNRICESENHPYLIDNEDVDFSEEQWRDAFSKSRWGRNMIKKLRYTGLKLQEDLVCDLSWLPTEEIYYDSIKHILEAEKETVANIQRRQLFDILNKISLSSPFRQFILTESQVAGLLSDRRAVYVKDSVGHGDEY